MIDDLDRTIRELLLHDMPSARSGQVDISFHQPNREWQRDRTSINFFLYDVRQNPVLRQHQWREMVDSTNRSIRQDQSVPLHRTPLRIDCYYMVTAWSTSNEPIDEHRLLTECLVTLARYPVLNRYEHEETRAAMAAVSNTATQTRGDKKSTKSNPKAQKEDTTSEGAVENNRLRRSNLQYPAIRNYLVGALRDLTYEIPTRLAEHDVLTNPAEVWGSVENSMKAAFSYVVTLPILPWMPLETREVATTSFIFGQANHKTPTNPQTGVPIGRPTLQSIDGDGSRRAHQIEEWPMNDQMLSIGGTVSNILDNDESVADLEVYIKDSGLYTRTDAEGHFHFPHLRLKRDQITLVVKPPRGKAVEKKVSIPATTADQYDVTIRIASPRRKRS
ncbi:MAG TPA: DUF4255 domain-containing protein [Caldilineaceae bacterium]|nr:DUF4255 domain-containing protein [Caldilineaceae bacterium]